MILNKAIVCLLAASKGHLSTAHHIMQVTKPANIKIYTSNNSSDMPKKAFQIVLNSDLIFLMVCLASLAHHDPEQGYCLLVGHTEGLFGFTHQ